MKVLMINGSTRKNGSTRAALGIMEELLQAQGLETEIYWVGNQPIRDCTGCRACRKTRDNTCVFKDDDINLLIKKAEAADGFVFGTPVYYSSSSSSSPHPTKRPAVGPGPRFLRQGRCAPGQARLLLRHCQAGQHHPGAGDQRQYFLYNEMPLASGSY